MSNLTIKEYKKAFVLEDKQNHALAEKSYQIAIENDNNFGSKELGVGVLHQFYGFFEKAIKEYKKELEKDLKDETKDKIYLNLALCLDRSHFYEEAIFYYKKTSTNEGFVNYRVSELYKKLKDFELSNNYLEKLKIKKIVPKFEWKHGISYGSFMQNERLKTSCYFIDRYKENSPKLEIGFFECFEGNGIDNIALKIAILLLDSGFIKEARFTINNLKNLPTNIKKRKGFRFLSKDSLDYIDSLLDSKIIVSNSILPDYFIRRDEQILFDYSGFRPDFPKNNKLFDAILSKNLLQATHILSKQDIDIFLENSSISYIFDAKIAKYHEDFGYLDFIKEPKTKKEPSLKNILIYGGSFANDGQKSSFLNFLKIVPKDKFNITLIVDINLLKDKDKIEVIEKNIPKDIKILAKYQDVLENLEEKEISLYLQRNKEFANSSMEKIFIDAKKREVKRFLSNTTFDIAIDFSGFSDDWLGFFAGVSSKKKIVFSHFEKDFSDIVEYSNLHLLFSSYRWFNTIATLSKPFANEKKELFVEKFSLQNSDILYINNVLDIENTVELSKKEIENNHIKELLEDKNYTNFISIGRLDSVKNHKLTIEAFYKVFNKGNRNIRLFILGDGDLKDDLQKQIESLNLTNHIFLLGYLDNPFNILEKCDSLLHSSLIEGQAMVLYEAMILKKPIIASSINANIEVLKDKTGVCFGDSSDMLSKYIDMFLKNLLDFKDYDINIYQEEAKRKLLSLLEI